MMRRGIVLVVGCALLAGCGGDDGEEETSTTRTPSVARFLGELPVGYRDAPAPRPEVEKAFREKVTRDFDATEVEVRNVYLGAQFVAGELAVRARRPVSIATVADKAFPGHLRPKRITIAGKQAYLVIRVDSAGEQEVAIVDTVGPVVLLVTAQRFHLARKLAARFVR